MIAGRYDRALTFSSAPSVIAVSSVGMTLVDPSSMIVACSLIVTLPRFLLLPLGFKDDPEDTGSLIFSAVSVLLLSVTWMMGSGASGLSEAASPADSSGVIVSRIGWVDSSSNRTASSSMISWVSSISFVVCPFSGLSRCGAVPLPSEALRDADRTALPSGGVKPAAAR